MKYLTADFGSTYTKLTAIDAHREEIVGTAAAFTTITTNVMNGFHEALKRLETAIGTFAYDKLLCCSSAAGGLRMVALARPGADARRRTARRVLERRSSVPFRSRYPKRNGSDRGHRARPGVVVRGYRRGQREVIVSNARKLADAKGDFSSSSPGTKVPTTR